jgi:hypothetical protein
MSAAVERLNLKRTEARADPFVSARLMPFFKEGE